MTTEVIVKTASHPAMVTVHGNNETSGPTYRSQTYSEQRYLQEANETRSYAAHGTMQVAVCELPVSTSNLPEYTGICLSEPCAASNVDDEEEKDNG